MDIQGILDLEKNASTLNIRIKSILFLKDGHLIESFLKKEDLSIYENVNLDLKHLNKYDSMLVVFVKELNERSKNDKFKFDVINSNADIDSFVARFIFEESAERYKKVNTAKLFFENAGKNTIAKLEDSKEFIEFFGNIIISFFRMLFSPSIVRWEDFPFQFLRAGVNAIPIVLLILFLLGLITGYQGAIQLKQYGADIYIADLVGVSITRELSPLMVAIIVAGRSGSAFAAEIGTMKVSEEVDALKTMGFDVFSFLVMPRLLAVALAMPFLTMLADLSGVIGGMISGLAELNITMTGYFNEMNSVLWYSDILTGLFKSIVFGIIISAVGCYRGLQVSGGAESVGKFTTASVVTSIFLIIVSNAIFTILFQSMEI